jgi:hypothetical protein
VLNSNAGITSVTTAIFEVASAEDARLGLLLPSAMEERYEGPSLAGRARYTNYRKYQVDTSTDIGTGRK